VDGMMDISIRQTASKYIVVKVEEDNTTLTLGLLDKKEALEFAEKLSYAVYELISFTTQK